MGNGYIEKLSGKLCGYFDIERDWDFAGIHYDLYAKSFIRNERYILSKKAAIYGFENHEHCLVKYYPELSMQQLYTFIEGLKNASHKLVVPSEEHMSSIITGVLVAEGQPNPDIIDTVKRFKYHKGFVFGLKGWLDIRLLLVQLGNGEVIANRKAKEVAKFYSIKGTSNL